MDLLAGLILLAMILFVLGGAIKLVICLFVGAVAYLAISSLIEKLKAWLNL